MHLFYVAFILWATALGQSTGGRLPPSLIPESVINADPGVQFLWNQVEEGILHKRLPWGYEATERAWIHFVHTRAEPIIHSYYKSVTPHLFRQS